MQHNLVVLLMDLSGTNPSAQLGFSVSGAGSVLGLGLFGQFTFSDNGDLGNLYYVSRDFLSGASNSPYDGSSFTYFDPTAAFTTFASSQLGCALLRSDTDPVIQCFAHNSKMIRRNAGFLSRPDFTSCVSGTLSRQAPPVNIKSQSMCFGISASVWLDAIALTGMTKNRTRFFGTYFVRDAATSTPTVRCSSGCFDDGELITSNDPTFGDAIALYNDIVVVGVPGDSRGSGAAIVYRAVGESKGSEYGIHTRWSMAGRLINEVSNPGSLGRFGAGLSLGPNYLAVAAPGNTQSYWQGTVTVFAYQSSNVSLDFRAICKVERSNSAEDSSFGLAMAQSSGDDGGTILAVGSPDENSVYLLWIRVDGSCDVRKSTTSMHLNTLKYAARRSARNSINNHRRCRDIMMLCSIRGIF